MTCKINKLKQLSIDKQNKGDPRQNKFKQHQNITLSEKQHGRALRQINKGLFRFRQKF